MRKRKKSVHGSSADKSSPGFGDRLGPTPSEPIANEEQAESLIDQGRLEEAETIYRKLIAAGSKNHLVYGNLAAVLGLQGKHSEVVDLLRKALVLYPNFPDAQFNLGNALRERGDLDAAITAYKKALSLTPYHLDAQRNLGTALEEQGNLKAAVEAYEKAHQLSPSDPEICMNQAFVLHRQGDLDAAIACFQKALQLAPDDPNIHVNIGIARKEQGDLSAAIDCFNKALAIQANHAHAHASLGAVWMEKSDWHAAISSYRKALESSAENPDFHNNLGNALRQTGDLNAAIGAYQKAISLRPEFPEALDNLGLALKESGDLPAAIASHRRAIALKPGLLDAHNHLGLALRESGEFSAAIASLNQALALNPDFAKAHYNLGLTLYEYGDLPGAHAAYSQAISLEPRLPYAHNNLGTVLLELGRPHDAISCFAKELDFFPDNVDDKVNLAMAELMVGRYEIGWQRYENRLLNTQDRHLLDAAPACPRWDGRPLTTGDRLLVVFEQGNGDTLQFMRYLPALRKQGVDVSICAPVHLHSLIQGSGIDPDPLVPEDAPKRKDGFWVPLLSIPGYLGVRPDNPVVAEQYIHIPKELKLKWQAILSSEGRPVVAINWQGNPETEKGVFRGRSLPLETFSVLAALPKISFLSLQKGFGSEQLEACSFRHRFVRCQDQVNETWDFLETAAIIANCDLVITSDTAVAHLAGGTGIPTWLLLKKVPDWRWGVEGETTFWYPSMRLFRQQERGNWQEVLERVASELGALFAGAEDPLAVPPASSLPRPASPGQPLSSQGIVAPISLGELIDKITILQNKIKFASDLNRLPDSAPGSSQRQLDALQVTLARLPLAVDPVLIQRLGEVNQNLWRLKDAIREQERQKTFGETFIYLARSLHQLNDRRAAIKEEIDAIYRPSYGEKKSI